MSILGKLFGSKPKSIAQAQLPEVEAALTQHIADFQDTTRLHNVLVCPILHKVAVKLFVEDFGAPSTLKQYERLVASFTSDGTFRESQFSSFGWPDVPPEEASHTSELDALLWKIARGLIARGILKETIGGALVNIALKVASKGINPFISVGFLVTVLKEIRAGVYTPPPEVRPEVSDGTDEATTAIFNTMRDFPTSLRSERDSTGNTYFLACKESPLSIASSIAGRIVRWNCFATKSGNSKRLLINPQRTRLSRIR
jgi:hypothetical protein